MTEIQLCLDSFHEVLSRLASPAEEQARYLTELGVAESLDELALEFDDSYRPLRVALGSLPDGPEVSAACHAVDTALTSESLGWTFDDLNSAEWDRIRHLASNAHKLVGSSIAGGQAVNGGHGIERGAHGPP